MQIRRCFLMLALALLWCAAGCASSEGTDVAGTIQQGISFTATTHPGTQWGTWWDLMNSHGLSAAGDDSQVAGIGGNPTYGRLSVVAPLGDWPSMRRTSIWGVGTWLQYECGYDHCVALKSDGTVWVIGQATNGTSPLCLGPTTLNITPFTRVLTQNTGAGLPAIIRVAAGGWSTFLEDASGNWYVCGRNNEGQLATGSPATPWSRPTLNTRLSGFNVIYPGAYHTVARKVSPVTPYCWGSSPSTAPACGFVSTGQYTPRLMEWPAGITPPGNILSLDVGERFTILISDAHAISPQCPLGATNQVVAVGSNVHGEFGGANPTDMSNDSCLAGPQPFTPFNPGGVVAGRYHSLVWGKDVSGNLALLCSGDNRYGQCGDGTTNNIFGYKFTVSDPQYAPSIAFAGPWTSFWQDAFSGISLGAGLNDHGQTGTARNPNVIPAATTWANIVENFSPR